MFYESWNFDFLISAIPLMLLISLLLFHLALCFFGCYMLRVLLPLFALIGGFVLGWWLLVSIRPQSGDTELYAGGIFVGVALILGACFFYRLFFGLFFGILITWAISIQFWPLSPLFIAFFIVIGLFATMLFAHFASNLGKISTALDGAFWTIVIILQLIGWIATPGEIWWVGVLPLAGIAVLTIILAVVGCYVQFSVARWIARSRQAKARAAARLLGPSRLTIGQAAQNMHPPE